MVHVALAITACAGTAACIAFVFQCHPVEFFWNRAIPGGHCLPGNASFLANAVISLMIDIWILLIPIPTVWRLRIPTRQKIALSVIFMIGLL